MMLWEEMVFLTKAASGAVEDDETQQRDAASIITAIADTIVILVAIEAQELRFSHSHSTQGKSS